MYINNNNDSGSAIKPEERMLLKHDPMAWPFLEEPDDNHLSHFFEVSDVCEEVHYMHVWWQSTCDMWRIQDDESGEEWEATSLTQALAIVDLQQ